MPSPAPNLCGRTEIGHAQCTSYAHIAVHTAYVNWAEHYNSCAHCSKEDWYMPGGVLLDVEDSMADGSVLLVRDGESVMVNYRRGVDLAVLCNSGAQLFKLWQNRATTNHAPSRS